MIIIKLNKIEERIKNQKWYWIIQGRDNIWLRWNKILKIYYKLILMLSNSANATKIRSSSLIDRDLVREAKFYMMYWSKYK